MSIANHTGANHSISVTVVKEARLATTATLAWALIRDFNAMPAWNEAVQRSHIEHGPADRIGCRRVLQFDGAGLWIHELTGLSDVDMKLQYRIVEAPQPMPIPMANYRAEMLVIADAGQDMTAPGCTIRWRAEFDTPEPESMKRRALEVFDKGFEGLRRRLSA